MPLVSNEKLNEIRAKADIVEIVREYVPLEVAGKNYKGVCPFHEDHSPSMSVSPDKQIYKCFACGASGNAFQFVQNIENISFIEAVKKIADKIGVPLDIGEIKKTSSSKYEEEYKTMNLAMLYFQNNLNSLDGKKALEYLSSRGLDEKTIKDFNIGLSPLDNKLYKFLTSKKVDIEVLSKLGLVNQNGLNYYDLFRNRIMFPIHDAEGNVVGFTGRIYNNEDEAKYVNSKETIIFKKSNILFNYHRAKNEDRLKHHLILVEGNMDAIRMYENGFLNTVALQGTALTNEQVELINKLRCKRVTLMFDNDNAGALATMTNGEILLKANIPIDVVRLSLKKDPDEYILTYGKEAMEDNIAHAESFINFKLNYLKNNKNLNDTRDLVNYLKEVVNSLKDEDDLTKEVTISKLSKDYDISIDTLKEMLPSKESKVINKEINPKKEKAITNKKLTLSIYHILYYMMNDERFIKIYQDELGFFNEKVYRGIAAEIIYYLQKYGKINLADFLTYQETSPLKDEIRDILDLVTDDNPDPIKMHEYINNVKEYNLNMKIKSIKEELKSESDVLRQEELGNQLIKANKDLQKIKRERSVKND